MDSETLVDSLIEDGKKLVEYLTHRGFEVTAALWLRNTYNEKWRYYLISPLVDAIGPMEARKRLHPLIYSRPQCAGEIDPLKVTLIGLSDPIARDALAALARIPGPHTSPIRWPGRVLGNVCVEDVYFYPVPAAAA